MLDTAEQFQQVGIKVISTLYPLLKIKPCGKNPGGGQGGNPPSHFFHQATYPPPFLWGGSRATPPAHQPVSTPLLMDGNPADSGLPVRSSMGNNGGTTAQKCTLLMRESGGSRPIP